MVTKGPFMEFIGERIDQTAADTYEEKDISTPTSKSEKLAMLIHLVEFDFISDIDTIVDDDEIVLQLTKATKSAIIFADDPDLIARRELKAKVNTNGMSMYEQNKQFYFDPPILYARSKIHVGINTVGQAAAKAGAVRIGYTLDKVSEADFIAALTD